MRKLYQLCAVFGIVLWTALPAAAQTITVGSLSPAGPYCSAATPSISFTTSAAFAATQTFTAELSDATGNFPGSSIGSTTGTGPGPLSIALTLPTVATTSTLFQIRIIATPASVTSLNTTGLTIMPVPVPTLTPAPAGTVCTGTPVTYTTEAGKSNYTWTFSGTLNTNYTLAAGTGTGTSNTATVTWLTPAAPASVSVNYSNGACVAAAATSVTTTVVAAPVPTLGASPAGGVCAGTPVTYTTEAAQSNYVWTFSGTLGVDYTLAAGTGISTSNTATVTWLTPAAPASVSVNYSNGTCSAAAPASATTTVAAVPTPTFTTPTAGGACTGVPITYTTQAGQSNYVWNISGGPGDFLVTPGTATSTSNIATITWVTTGARTVSVNYSNGTCSAASPTVFNVNVVVLPVPTFVTPASTAGCIGIPISYTTQAGQSTYSWSFPGTLGVDYTLAPGTGTATTEVATITWLTAGNKTVTVNYSNGTCGGLLPASFTSNIVAQPTPTFTTPASSAGCTGLPITYTTQNGMSFYAWTFSGTQGVDYTLAAGTGTASSNIAAVTWLTPGSKTITVNYSNGSCSAVTPGSFTSNVTTPPTATFTTPAVAGGMCLGVPVTYTTQAGRSNYIWTFSGTAGVNYTLAAGTGTNTSNIATVTWLTAGSKTVTVNYTDGNGCSSAAAASITKTANTVPVATFTAPPGASVCINNPITYTTQTGGGISNYVWTFSGVAGVDYSLAAGTGTSASNTAIVTWLTAGSKTVTVNYSDANACVSAAAATSTTTVNPSVTTPVFSNAPSFNTRCQGAASVSYTASASNTTGIITYSLDAASLAGGNSIVATTGVVSYAAGWSGNSTITASAPGCNGPLTATFNVSTVGIPVFASGTTSNRCQGFGVQTYTATSVNNTGLSYAITSGGAGSTINTSTGTVTFDPAAMGAVVIEASATGCSSTLTSTHTVNISAGVGPTTFNAPNLTPCQGTSVTYNASAANNTGITYSITTNPLAGATIGAASGVANFNPSFVGTATITATASGCGPSTSTSVNVVITPVVTTPIFNAGPQNTICQNPGTITYTATASNASSLTYSVSPGSAGTINTNTGQLSYSNSFNGTATITAVATGCNGTASNTFVVNVTATVAPVSFGALGSISTRKQGAGSITYTATASNSSSISYVLSPAAAGNIVVSTGAVTYSPAFSGVATITATAAGCNGPTVATHTVTVVQTPVFTLGATSSRCQGAGTVTYGAATSNTPGATIAYSLSTTPNDPATTINTSTGAVTYNVAFSGTAVVTAIATQNSVSTDPATHTVTVNIAPRLTSPTPTSKTICSGNNTAISLVATTGAGSNFSWTINGGSNITGKGIGTNLNQINQTLVNSSPSAPDTVRYIVTVTSPAGCLSVVLDTIVVPVNPKPVLTPVTSPPICSRSIVNIAPAASTPSTFSWVFSGPSKITSTSQSGTGNISNVELQNSDIGTSPTPGTATFTITPTSLVGCVGNPGTASVTVNPLPVASVTGGNSKTICSGFSANVALTANLASTFTFSRVFITSLGLISGSSSGTGSNINQTLSNSSNSIADSVAYRIVPTSNGAGCVGDTATVVVRVNPNPAVTTAATSQICSGVPDTTTLSATLPSTFSWSIGSVSPGISGQSPNPTSVAVTKIGQILTNTSNVNPGFVEYIVTPTTISLPNCVGSPKLVTLQVNPLPKLTSASSRTICSDDSLRYTPESSVASGVTIFRYDRNSPILTIPPRFGRLTTEITDTLFTDFILTPTVVDYNFVLQSAAGCTLGNQHLLVTVNPRPDTPGISVFPRTKLCSGASSMNFSSSRLPDSREFFKWSVSGGGAVVQKGDSSFSQNALIGFPNAGSATVTVRSNVRGFGCLSRPTIKAMPVASALGNQSIGVVLFANNLVAQVAGAKAYQWGFDRKSDLDSTLLVGETTQSYDTRRGFRTNDNYYWVMVTFPDDCVQKAYFNGVSLGVQPASVKAATMSVYPNPAQDMVTLELMQANSKDLLYEIYDLTGKRLTQVSSSNAKTRISVAEFAPGYYTVICTQAGIRIATSRFIKN